ncbi:hypothetical protein BU23DRAFT_548494 [Bimuria novae-zelandiae CBS 107.79]|uniref:Uncharacterized protein n=1 Tax=Bimuria novae-zelandiae CBS 107.79 TaxID=1447943 RepID=A0A6A5VRJ7_9PLEO|nr:hypothetical protein BU23DRAFT_548494 [Bimuria novae-zelandiae CBS 107.79]
MARAPTTTSKLAPGAHSATHKHPTSASSVCDHPSAMAQLQGKMLSFQPEQLDPARSRSIHQLGGPAHMLTNTYQSPAPAQNEEGWDEVENLFVAELDNQSSEQPAQVVQAAFETQHTYASQESTQAHGQANFAAAKARPNSAHTKLHYTPETRQKVSIQSDPHSTGPRDIAGRPGYQLDFVMTESKEVTILADEDVETASESGEDVDGDETEAAELPSSDTSYHEETADRAPEQKLYLRLTNLRQNSKGSRKRSHSNQESVGDRARSLKRAKLDNNTELPSSSLSATSPAPKRKPGASPKQKTAHKSPISTPRNSEAYSNVSVPVPNLTSHEQHRFHATFDDRTKQIFDHLVGRALKVLPDISDEQDETIKWTAKSLTNLYIYSLTQGCTKLCDLVADLWIHGFHERARGKPCGVRPFWMENTAHTDREPDDYKCRGMPPKKKWQKELDLPELNDNVTVFHPELVNQLYHHTPRDHPVRNLWADSIALGGPTAEKILLRMRKNGTEFHEDFIWDVMCTSLRMARKKLTLRIEMLGKDAWCERYHIHGKETPCHRAEAVCSKAGPSRASTHAVEEDETLYEQDEGRRVRFEGGAGQGEDNAIKVGDYESEEE